MAPSRIGMAHYTPVQLGNKRRENIYNILSACELCSFFRPPLGGGQEAVAAAKPAAAAKPVAAAAAAAAASKDWWSGTEYKGRRYSTLSAAPTKVRGRIYF